VFPVSTLRFLLALVLGLASVCPARLSAQDSSSPDDPNETPLGDVARNLRNNNPPPKQVIDNDNLTDVMDRADGQHTSIFKFLMAGDGKTFRLAAPDVTCSLSFTASTKALLTQQYAQMELPASELSKLTGPATIEGDALSVSLFNGTNWHVSEIDVAFTLVPTKTLNALDVAGTTPLESSSSPFAVHSEDFESDAVRPEKKPDRTVIYKMRAAAPPSSGSTFSAPLDLDITPGQEWHWAIVEAKGYPPQNRQGTADQTSSADGSISGTAATPSDTTIPAGASPAGAFPLAFRQPQ
jgi:hypothetical protein